MTSLGLYSYQLTPQRHSRPWPLSLTMRSTAYSDGDVGALLKVTDVFFFCCCWIMCFSFLGKPGVCAFAGEFSLIIGIAETLCIGTVIGIWCSSITMGCRCTKILWNGPAFRGCILLEQALATSTAVLAVSVNAVYLQTLINSVKSMVWRGIWHCRTVCIARPAFSSDFWPWSEAPLSYFERLSLATQGQCQHNYQRLMRSVGELLLAQAGALITQD